jgi:sporulation killing factor system integral membrane protein
MIRYLNSPLKIAGILLALSGILLFTLTQGYYWLMGVSISMMGLIVLATVWMLQKSMAKTRQRLAFEVFLFCVISLFAVVIILDFIGLITIQKFI